MLEIRRSQFTQLAAKRSAAQEEGLLQHLRTHFAEATSSLDDAQLLAHISATIARASRYELESEADRCRFVNLAAAFGWEFDADPEYAWMRAMLTDASVSSPGDRLRLLADESVRRLRVQEHNDKVRTDFAQGKYQGKHQ